jgi:proline-specific peptidase
LNAWGFFPPNGIEFYYYDQLDSTNSDKPGDPGLWTVERFCHEFEAVRKGLGLEEFYLLGHSWGGMLAIEYSLAYPEYLKGLIISNMAASIRSFEKHFSQLRAALPDDVKKILDKYEKSGQYEAPEYKKVVFDEGTASISLGLALGQNQSRETFEAGIKRSTTTCRAQTSWSALVNSKTGTAGLTFPESVPIL